MKYKAFLSYSHAGDSRLAPALHLGVNEKGSGGSVARSSDGDERVTGDECVTGDERVARYERATTQERIARYKRITVTRTSSHRGTS